MSTTGTRRTYRGKIIDYRHEGNINSIDIRCLSLGITLTDIPEAAHLRSDWPPWPWASPPSTADGKLAGPRPRPDTRGSLRRSPQFRRRRARYRGRDQARRPSALCTSRNGITACFSLCPNRDLMVRRKGGHPQNPRIRSIPVQTKEQWREFVHRSHPCRASRAGFSAPVRSAPRRTGTRR